jgi:hypothetical protein
MIAPATILAVNMFTTAYGLYLLAAESTTVAMKHLAEVRYVDMNGQPVSCCCTMVAMYILSSIFTAMFCIEGLACCCDVEQRQLSMQVMGVRYARIGVAYTGPAGVTFTGGSAGAVGLFLLIMMGVILAIFIAVIAVASSAGFAQWGVCYAHCAAAFGMGPGVCTGMCDVQLQKDRMVFAHLWNLNL